MKNNYKHIWIIDDDGITRFIIKKNLENAGVGEFILEFGLGEDALSHLRNDLKGEKELPDLILLDINMPEMNAWDFMKEFQNITSKIDYSPKILIVTSSINSLDRKRAEKIKEITGFIVKPFSVEQLLS